jgi:ribA/ribD-fused uncharacterized protein
MNIDTIKTRDELIDFIGNGNKVKYLPFWGHTPKDRQAACKSCFSQWYDAPFKQDGVLYKTAEHYMMAHKARLFHDSKAYQKILESNHPKAAKSIGREISGFSEAVWLEHRFAIVVAGNIAKFSCHPEFRAYLLNTGERVLVEASPVDTIWGIGLAVDHANVENPEQWLGLNLLGFALIQARSVLKARIEQ